MFVSTWKNILKLWIFSRTCRKSRLMFSICRKYWSVCKYLEKYSEAFGIFFMKKNEKKVFLLAAGFEPGTPQSPAQSSTIMPLSQVWNCGLIRVYKVNVISKTWPQQPLTYICWTHIWVHYTTIISSSSANLLRPVRSFENSSFGGS